MSDGVFISVGSNIDPEANVFAALERLNRKAPILRISIFYLTEPIGRPEQQPFYNGVVEVETSLEPHPLKFSVLRKIEAELGRERTEDRFAARTIDLDILLHGNRVIREQDLEIPDPEIGKRPFLALPLLELVPRLVLPGSDLELEKASFEDHGMKPLEEYSARLRKKWCGQA